jgi:heme-degrading monooxygenase HmoA
MARAAVPEAYRFACLNSVLWKSEADFVRWTESEDFRHAHANRPPKEMFAGPNVFEMHEVIQATAAPIA